MNDKRKNIVLVKWRERYKNLLDTLNIGFVLLDNTETNTVLDVNKTYSKMTGMSREDIVGHTSLEFYGEAELKRLKKIVLPLKNKNDYQFEFTLTSSSGERIPVLHNVHISKDSEGHDTLIYTMITDIREQKQIQKELEAANQALIASFDTMEKEKKKLEAILFGIGDCVTIFDPEGTVLLSNPKGIEIRGKRRTPLWPLKFGGQKQITLQVGDERRQFLGQVQEIRDQQGVVYAYVETLKDITPQIRLVEREHELSRIKREMRRKRIETEMIGVSRAMQNVFEFILRCSEVDSTILILGETGVGKEVAARAIHSQSSRKDQPFVAINCGALPETLLESELFGHVKGAFTGAISTRPGLFQEAQRGTLFLDEVGDLNSALQIKLLRVLQEKEVRPVGSDQSYSVDVRVITATNRDLEELVNQNRFRHDLYYRIAVIPLLIPTLRERKEDIIPLAEYFMKKYRKKNTISPRVLDHPVQQILLDYSWPGNIRELENAIEHCIAMSHGPLITVDYLPVQILESYQSGKSHIWPKRHSSIMDKQPQNAKISETNAPLNLLESEKATISQALRRRNENRTLAAKDLGISRSTIIRKIKRYNLA
ncbi:MAG: sigma 54-interacting transcriptional regulator [Deltaproteobacteria bacterium]|nr:sigma 54-interacting transcriptional regulator [Deltaproteobacteria bacterium]